MKLELVRAYKNDQYTIGHLYIDNLYFCDTIEDVDRGASQEMHWHRTGETGYWEDSDGNKIEKIYGRTAIPAGDYYINVTYSPKFSRDLPLIMGVKGFQNIRIHSGNTEKDSLGCIIVGKNKVKGQVIKSKDTLNELMLKINEAVKAKDTIQIYIH